MKLFRVKSKKGITPIIAIILLMMMTVAAAGSIFLGFKTTIFIYRSSEQFGDSLNEYLNSQLLVDLAEYTSEQQIIQIPEVT